MWESLFLGDSGLRALIQHHVPLMSDGIDPFRLVPTLKFRNITINSGEVERFTASLSSIDPLTNEDQLALGAQIALWSYLGFGDLHWENILFGKKGDQFFFFPIDLEVASRDLLLPSHTWLLPDMAIPMEYCGLYKFLSFLKINLNPLLLVIGYYKALTCLTILGNEIDRELLDVHLSRPLLTRVIFRKTQTYHQLLKGGSSDVDLKCPLFSSEREQLLRGDIPY